MQIITLTTDFGTTDYYSGAMKGAILNRAPQVNLVDISHQIEPYNIVQAALVLKNIYPEFPASTIHLVGVNCEYATAARFLVARRDGHFFLLPDNGLLALIFGEMLENEVVALPAPAEPEHFMVKKIFAGAVAKLAAGEPFESLGEAAGELVQRIQIQPVITKDRMRGTVLHIDNFGNAVVNIRRESFEKVADGRGFSLFFKRHDPITVLSKNYSAVEVGEPLCLFNSAGLLEISIYMGRAGELLGLKPEDVVEVYFE